MEKLRRVLLTSAVVIMCTACGSPVQHSDWTMTRLDLEVRVDHSPPAITAGGVIWVRLDGDGSDGPVLAVDGAGMRWTAVQGSEVAEVDLNQPFYWHSLGDFKAQLPSHRPPTMPEVR